MVEMLLADVSADALAGFAGVAIGFLLVTALYMVMLRWAALWVAKVQVSYRIATRISLISMGVYTLGQFFFGGNVTEVGMKMTMGVVVLMLTFLVACILCATMIQHPVRVAETTAGSPLPPGPLNYATPLGPEGPIGAGRGALVALVSLAMLLALVFAFALVVTVAATPRR